MAMGQQKDRQGDLMVSWSEMPRSPGHVFYDRLQLVLIEGGFDGFAEAVCQPYYAARMGAPSVPPGRYFRMHLVGYFEGIDSERGLEWRCSDSLSLREFLLLERRERVPDHSWLSRTRARLPHEVHTAVFDWVLALIAEAGLVKGERIGVDASTMEANAALRNIVRRDTGEGYQGMLERLAQESGIETPTAEDLARLDRKRKGKKLSNQDWVSRSDPEAKIAKMKDGTTHLAYKPEHAVDLDTGAVVAAELHPADEGDRPHPPWTPLDFPSRIHLCLFVHRIHGLLPGLYVLVRDEARLDAFRAACHDQFAWKRVESSGMPLYALALGDCREAAAHASCFQEIAGDSAFSLGMLADFARTLEEDGAWAYRRLFWETGLIGQVLYLEAEAAGVRSTGMGCYFDDVVHQLLGIDLLNDAWQSLYHFTVGGAVDDGRLTTLPAYGHLPPERTSPGMSGI